MAERKKPISFRFLGSAMMTTELQDQLRSMGGNAQKGVAMYGTTPEKMAIAMVSDDHRVKSLLARAGHDGLVYACLRLNPTIEFEVEERLYKMERQPVFASARLNGEARKSGMVSGNGINAKYSIRSDGRGRIEMDISFSGLMRSEHKLNSRHGGAGTRS